MLEGYRAKLSQGWVESQMVVNGDGRGGKGEARHISHAKPLRERAPSLSYLHCFTVCILLTPYIIHYILLC